MAKSPEPFTVFYAWQSDTPANHCRYLIREALDEAADALNADPSTPYRVVIDQDTQNVPGLCDIPATLLDKIQNAGAVVADLTYVATTANDPAKHCSNPNVLFELGFAFHAVGHQRLVCVMNEAHGPRSEQIFDLGHRRHPIGFKSPADGGTRAKAKSRLATELADALRPIVSLGPRTAAADDEARHEAERATIASVAVGRSGNRAAPLTFSLCPVRYETKRWPDVDRLERIARNRSIRSGHHEFPPQRRGTAAMSWGIFNDTYGDPWALTYAGQFWIRHFAAADYEGPEISERIKWSVSEPVEGGPLQPGRWVSFLPTMRRIYDTLAFAASLSGEFHESETLRISLVADGLAGLWMGFKGPGSSDDPCGPCVSPDFVRRTSLTAGELQAGWEELCAVWSRDFTDLFSRDGRRVTLSTIQYWMKRFAAGEFAY